MNATHWNPRFRSFAAYLQSPFTTLLRDPTIVRFSVQEDVEPETLTGFTFFFRLVGEEIPPGLLLGFEFDSPLLLGLLDRLQGGEGVNLEEDAHARRALTGLEKRLVSRFLVLMHRAIRETWGLAESFEFESMIPPDWGEGVFFSAAVFRLNVGVLDGKFRILIPQLRPEPVKNAQISKEVRLEDAENVADSLASTPVKISVQLSGPKIRPKDVMCWKVGDVVSLGRPEDFPFTVLVEGMEKFRAAPGKFKSRKAFRILGD